MNAANNANQQQPNANRRNNNRRRRQNNAPPANPDNVQPVEPRPQQQPQEQPQPQQQQPRQQPTVTARTGGLAATLRNPTANRPNIKPQNVSTVPSVEKNDVLMKDSILVDGVSAGVPCERDCKFQLDYTQFMQLIASSYRVMTRQDRGLQKFVSLSQYTYYCEILLWKRLYYVLTARGDGVNAYEALKRKLPPMAIPQEIG